MKGPRELKRCVAKSRDHLKACHWEDMNVFKLMRCKKWERRQKRVDPRELDDDLVR